MTVKKLLNVGPDLDRLEKHRAKYIRCFADCKKVLDIGCGRGVFLELLKKHNIEGEGVDKEEEIYLSLVKNSTSSKSF